MKKEIRFQVKYLDKPDKDTRSTTRSLDIVAPTMRLACEAGVQHFKSQEGDQEIISIQKMSNAVIYRK